MGWDGPSTTNLFTLRRFRLRLQALFKIRKIFLSFFQKYRPPAKKKRSEKFFGFEASRRLVRKQAHTKNQQFLWKKVRTWLKSHTRIKLSGILPVFSSAIFKNCHCFCGSAATLRAARVRFVSRAISKKFWLDICFT